MSGLILKTAGMAGVVAAVALASTQGLLRVAEMDEGELARVAAAPSTGPHPRHVPRAAPPSGSREPFSVVLAAQRDGHYYAAPVIEGARIPMMVDTGASSIALSYEDANRIGIRPMPSDFIGKSFTANGVGRFAPVTLREVALGDIYVRDVQASVHERGALKISLLGMSFLSKLSRVEVANGRLYLRK